MVPFAKTGGLADVIGALPYHLEKLNHNISVFMPLYKQIKESGTKLEKTEINLEIKVGNELIKGRIWKTLLPKTKAYVYFLENDAYYDRSCLYSTPQGDYPDNAERFIFFSRAVIEAIKILKLSPDIIHCHEWQTALIPVYLKTLYKNDNIFKNVKTAFTIHNLAYQGVFDKSIIELTGLDKKLFNWKELEFWGHLNFMKSGLVFGNILTTASPTYAKEIQDSEYGCGLEGVLKERSKELYGILNGVDYNIWNPEIDKSIPAQYKASDLKGKAICKKHLQENQKLPANDTPLIGIVTRLAGQKGLDILLDTFDLLIKEDIQIVILGTGEEKYHKALLEKVKQYPEKLAVNIKFDDSLAHLITAGSDIFLMPSRYEPCGLNQLYSLKYGTIPIVRATGGLADTVVDYDGVNIKSATGFSFKIYSGRELLNTVKRAIGAYKDKVIWDQLMQNGLKQDWSWERSAAEYNKVYLILKG
jgi:starch synthase